MRQAAIAHERFEITRNGLPATVLLGADDYDYDYDYDSILETLAALSGSETVAALEQGIKELDNAEIYTAGQVKAHIKNSTQK